MIREQTINQLKRAWIQLEITKREKTNELWILEAQIEKIKSKLKSYGMEKNLGLDQELIPIRIVTFKQFHCHVFSSHILAR